MSTQWNFDKFKGYKDVYLDPYLAQAARRKTDTPDKENGNG